MKGCGGSQPCFCQKVCIVEETEERRLVFVFFLRRIWGGAFSDCGDEADRGREGSLFDKAA